MNSDSLYSFVFKGVLTKQALEKTEAKDHMSIMNIDEEEISSILCIDELPDDLVLKSKKMSYVFIAICTFENSIRDFISQKLLEEKGADWWKECVPKKVKEKAESRKEEEDKIKWHTQRGDKLITQNLVI